MNEQINTFDAATAEKSLDRIKPLLGTISDKSASRDVEEFWRKASNYIGVLYGMDAALEKGDADEEAMGKLFARETDAILNEGKKLDEAIANKEVISKIKKLFRECLIPIGMKSKIVKHAFLKPSGYAGDFGLIEIIYNNKTLSRGFGYAVDYRFQIDDYAKAVRSRKDRMKEMLAGFLKDSPERTIDILNIACGSCREIKEMYEEYTFDESKKISFSLVDRDQEALDFSKKALENSPSNVEYNFFQHSIYDYTNNPDQFKRIFNGKNLIYTIGLADYISDESLKALITFLYDVLKPGGKLIIAHKDSKNFSPLAADWWCDWTFHLRDEPETTSLVKSSGIKDFSMSIVRENKTNIIFFIIIGKNK